MPSSFRRGPPNPIRKFWDAYSLTYDYDTLKGNFLADL
jgi:hypothetical protein